MTRWIRFEHEGAEAFGTLDGDVVTVCRGDMFANPQATETRLPLASARVLTPCTPSKMIALWNNFRALGVKLGQAVPEEPLYFIKTRSSYADPGSTITRPPSYAGKVIYEGELGIVIGTRCANVAESDAEACIFGYTCVNDVTAVDILQKDPTFPQWVRAKSFDGFGPFGPVIATGLRPEDLNVRTILNGQERQNYPVADMLFSPRQLVSRISHDMTLWPGDLICCGTSIGAGTMKDASNVVEIDIAGIGTLTNTFVQ